MAITFEGTSPGEPPRVIFNVDGAPRTARLAPPLAPKRLGKDEPPARAELPAPAEEASSPGCVVLGRAAFCLDRQGSVRRSLTTGEESRAIAVARPGTSIAAAPLGERAVVAFLADARTTEGLVMQAYVKVDDAPPVLLSEEGSGATYVTLAPWGDRVLAVYVDERRAMAPVHARMLGPGAAPALQIGRDSVVFVGEGGAGRLTSTIATGPGGLGFALLATSRLEGGFGMAAIRVEDPPRDDAPTAWSPYPESMTSAPIAATRAGSIPYAVRVRPVSAESKGPRALEIGHIDAKGQLQGACVLAEAKSFTDLAIEAAPDGTLWIAYSTGGKSWIEQRGAQPPKP